MGSVSPKLVGTPMGLLVDRRFRNVWLAGGLSLLGSRMSRMGLILYVVSERGSSLDLALLVLLDAVPGVLVAPLAGGLVDRGRPTSVMIAADLACALLLACVLWSPTFAVIYLTAALQSVVAAFRQPAASALLPSIVGDAELPRANGLEQSASYVVLIAGPVLGAQVFAQAGLAVLVAIDALSFVVSAVLVLTAGIAVPAARRAGWSVRATLGDVREGWTYLVRHPIGLHLALLALLAMSCTSVWTPLAPFFVRDHLGGSERLLGWQFGLVGAGAALGALWAPRLMARLGPGRTLWIGLLAEGVCLSAYALAARPGLSLAITFVWGLMLSMVVVPFDSVLQVVVDRPFLGRVFSVVRQTENGAMVLAMSVAVPLQGRWGTQAVLLSAGLAYVALAAGSSLLPAGQRLLALGAPAPPPPEPSLT